MKAQVCVVCNKSKLVGTLFEKVLNVLLLVNESMRLDVMTHLVKQQHHHVKYMLCSLGAYA